MTEIRRHPSSEAALLARLEPLMNFRPSCRYRAGMGDDAAVRVCARSERLVLTTDTLVEGVDFSLDYLTLRDVGFKAIAVNLSDCAAMGAAADGALAAVTFPLRCRRLLERMTELYRGIYRACRRWRLPVVGGDLSAGPCWSVTIMLIGRMGTGARILRRIGARAGDGLWVSGTPGDSAAGLAALRKWGPRRARSAYSRLIGRHIAPLPRMELGAALAADPSVHAVIDISDGVSKECHTLAHENRLGIMLDAASFPISPDARDLAARLGSNPVDWFLHGGEDFELLFAAGPGFDLRAAHIAAKTPITRIGVFIKGKGVWMKKNNGDVRWVRNRSWDHLKMAS